uniref:Uncharacterized protein n=1 Tax=Rhizophora mucronata TaxID=61149 RepID=A0A2P2J7C2_RHIMU
MISQQGSMHLCNRCSSYWLFI